MVKQLLRSRQIVIICQRKIRTSNMDRLLRVSILGILKIGSHTCWRHFGGLGRVQTTLKLLQAQSEHLRISSLGY